MTIYCKHSGCRAQAIQELTHLMTQRGGVTQKQLDDITTGEVRCKEPFKEEKQDGDGNLQG